MAELATATFYLGLVAYTVASTLFFVDLARRDAAQLTRFAPWALGVGLSFHAGHIVLTSLFSNICPVESLHFALSLSAFMAAGAYLVLRRKMRIDALGVAVAPLALTFMVSAQFVGVGAVSSDFPRPLLMLHIAANLLGFGLFLLAGFAGAFYLVQERRLKAKRASAIGGKLPALEALDRTLHRLLLVGFPLLTIGAVTGALFASNFAELTGATMARTVLSYAGWALVALVLILRQAAGWRGKRSAYGTLVGVACVAVVFAIYMLQARAGA